MRHVRCALMGATFLLGLAALPIGPATTAHAAAPIKIEVMDWFTSSSETAALRELVAKVNAAGGDWQNVTIAGFDQGVAAAQSAAAGGNPPTALQFNGGKQFDDLAERGLLNTIDGVAAEQDWTKVLPPALGASISRDGHYYGVPIDDHGETWMYTSSAAFKKAGVAVPTTWDAFFPAMDKLKAAGITPIAWGGQDWQEFGAFYTVLLSKEGPDLYNAVFRDKKIDAVNSAAFKDAVDTFGKMRAYVDAGSPNRNWNDATAMLIKGTGGVQFMGDFAKGEFTVAHMKEGQDYGCYLGLGANDHYFMMSTDVLIMPKGKGADRIAAQDLLAKVAMSKDAQLAFNNAKGGVPARLDIDSTKLDPCARKGYEALKVPGNQLAGPEMVLSADLMGSLTDVVTRFWSSPTMTSDQFIEKFAAAIKDADD
ncbi:ABC transporter substrate-binding protein [Acidisoma cladoniae]|uniref:ABC transporter substrate-binding protein n=1 Tax=Acidisoma cladoniae TaxID=3040935 RepID=UPI0025515603|nr:ABC transporter substrate-binding protein [Acidisoma sp. PAMC 29798]